MYVVSEYATCAVVTFTLSAFLLAISVVLLTIKDRLENRRGTSRAFQKAATLLGPCRRPLWHDTRGLADRGALVSLVLARGDRRLFLR